MILFYDGNYGKSIRKRLNSQAYFFATKSKEKALEKKDR